MSEKVHLLYVYFNSILNFSFKKAKVSHIDNLTDLLQQCSRLSAILANDLDVILLANVLGLSVEGVAPVKILIATPDPIHAPHDP